MELHNIIMSEEPRSTKTHMVYTHLQVDIRKKLQGNYATMHRPKETIAQGGPKGGFLNFIQKGKQI